MLDLVLIPISGILRRIIGGYPAGKYKIARELCKYLYGVVLGYLAIGLDPLIFACGIALYLGEKPGLGYWRGAIVRLRGSIYWEPHYLVSKRRVSRLPPVPIFQGTPEWYQLGPLATMPFISALIRGLIYGLPALPLCYFNPSLWVITASIGLAMPASGLLAYCMPDTKVLELGSHKTSWGHDELAEGVLSAALIVLFSSALVR